MEETLITLTHGNLLAADVEALVNTVNTTGVMGKGIALQFKRSYPGMFADYEEIAKRGEIVLGKVHVWETGQLSGPRYIINFPTKGHWRAKSKLRDIKTGLTDLIAVIRKLDIRSIAIPPLGCGNGGLNWVEVEPSIREAFEKMPDVDVQLFPPGQTPLASEMKATLSPPSMTLGRAALVALLEKYTEAAVGNPSLIESQKLMYFLQAAGEPLRLKYQRHHYGPYADNLRHVLKIVEGHYLIGFGDGSATVQEAEPLKVIPGAEAKAAPILDNHPETVHRIKKVVELTEGFETAYGLELLASVHWVVHEDAVPADADKVVEAIQSWSPRKGQMFTHRHIRVALETLINRGWTKAKETA